MSSSGYLHPLYASSLDNFGEPIELPTSKGWILKRPIPGTAAFDGMGCYPIFMCEDWSSLEKDLDWIGTQLVSLSLVTDPFGKYDPQELSRWFKDVAKPYKAHFVVDLQQQPEEFVSGHHQRNARKALEMVEVEVCPEPAVFLEEWISLYGHLIERHRIRGTAKFSPQAFARQLSVPGIVAFRAIAKKEPVGMLLWYIHGDIGYYHLGAYSPEGYKIKASFALFWILIKYFADLGLKWLSLGAGAGLYNYGQDGLSRFKHGWSTNTRTAYFLGRIFDPQKYQELVIASGATGVDFFPRYRLGEL